MSSGEHTKGEYKMIDFERKRKKKGNRKENQAKHLETKTWRWNKIINKHNGKDMTSMKNEDIAACFF